MSIGPNLPKGVMVGTGLVVSPMVRVTPRHAFFRPATLRPEGRTGAKLAPAASRLP